MSLIMRAALALEPGCRLHYEPPLGGGDFKSQVFFDAHRGKYAEFIGYAERLVGILDHLGRAPGRYIEPKCIKVRFEGEQEAYESINALHFTVIDPAKAAVVAGPLEDQRLGDLPHEPFFYPEDIVRFARNRPERFSDVPHQVGEVFIDEPFTKDGIPRYLVLETTEEHTARWERLVRENEARQDGDKLWLNPLSQRDGVNTPNEDLALVSRGNVYWLYHEPAEMHFLSDANEAEFWARSGISRPVGGDHTLLDSLRRFRVGEADVFSVQDLGRVSHYYPHRLLDRWAEHRPRVRALTERLYRQELSDAA